jgi:hypothetical protein
LAKIVDLHERICAAGVNPHVTIEGILMTMYDGRTNLSRLVVEEVRRVFEDLEYKTIIPRNVALSEAPSHELTVMEYAPNSPGARAYREAAAEFIRRQPQAIGDPVPPAPPTGELSPTPMAPTPSAVPASVAAVAPSAAAAPISPPVNLVPEAWLAGSPVPAPSPARPDPTGVPPNPFGAPFNPDA